MPHRRSLRQNGCGVRQGKDFFYVRLIKTKGCNPTAFGDKRQAGAGCESILRTFGYP